MADLNVSLILRLVDKATAPARAAMRMIDRMGGQGVIAQAARVHRGSVMMASGLGTVAGSATRALGVLGDYRTMLAGIGIGAIAGGFIRTAAEFENFNVQLTNLEGSSAGAARAMDWIETFATRTPLQVDETVAAYAKLKAFGIDPMNGTLQALTDTMAATGGGTEQLNGMVLAIGQSWTKGKLQGEEALQLLERGVPVYDLLAKKMGKTTEEIVAMQGAGELGREEIALLIEAMGEANLGAAEDMSKTWDGIISNLWDYWSKFQRLVMKSGVFDHLKGRLQSLLDVLNRMAADGSLLAMAERVSAGVIALLQGLWDFGAGVVSVWREVEPWITWAAEAVGGFGNALAILVGIKFASTILGLIGGFWEIGAGAWVALRGVARVAGRILGLTENIGKIGPAMAGAAAATETATARMNRSIRAVQLKTLTAGIGAYLAVTAIPEFTGKDRADEMAAWQKSNRDAMEGTFRATPVLGSLMKGYEDLQKWIYGEDFSPDGVKTVTDWQNNMKVPMANLVAWMKSQFVDIFPPMPSYERPGLMDPRTDYPYSPYYNDGAAPQPGAQPPDGSRATGGPVRAGGIYRWQENGEEMFQPSTDGSVINARGTRSMRAGAGRTTNVSLGGIVINAGPGQSPQAIAREVMAQVERRFGSGKLALHDGGDFDV